MSGAAEPEAVDAEASVDCLPTDCKRLQSVGVTGEAFSGCSSGSAGFASTA